MMRDAETESRTLLEPSVRSFEWRETDDCMAVAEQVVSQARAADLVLTSPPPDGLRGVGAGDILMKAGRPVLVVPGGDSPISLERIVIGWTDTRETRRAVSDALPLLKRASRVIVAEIALGKELNAARGRLSDVAAWLKRHGVVAETIAVASLGEDAARLNALADERDAGVIVAGGYGHSRLHEWALGGVTRDLLSRPDRCSLLSH